MTPQKMWNKNKIEDYINHENHKVTSISWTSERYFMARTNEKQCMEMDTLPFIVST